MALIELEDKLLKMLKEDQPEEFIYDFMETMGIHKATISRAKKDKRINLSKVDGDLYIKNKVYYRQATNDVLETFRDVEELLKDFSNLPRFTIVTDHKSFLAKDNKTKDTLSLDDINELPFNYDFFLPWQGIEKVDHDRENPADVKAAERFANLYQELKHDNPQLNNDEEQQFNVFLIRLLFMLFAEDTNIMPDSIFTDAIKRMTREDGS
ncbi:type IIL restriction-modification enzyme MmeI, partial [Fructobacillus fructosus]|uniref:type IIL restriction-modification enzyme MmeI n=1 Tax=Fructobacillus fructosus TaxID=1631 RepID=UPI0031F5B82C|nr:class I SAM-dependent DNA methyltransferase [Fructobacillus fructosus]